MKATEGELKQQLQAYIAYCKRIGSRVLVHIEGDICYAAEALSRIQSFSGQPAFIEANSAHAAAQIKRHLGSEAEGVVFNLHHGFSPNLMAALSACVKVGGLCVFITPPQSSKQPECSERLLKHVLTTLSGFSEDIVRISQDVFNIPGITETECGHWTPDYTEQAEVARAVQRVSEGHAKRPVVLQAPRGRGKTTALAMAAYTLMRSKKIDIALTASRIEAVDVLFRFLYQQADVEKSGEGKAVCGESSLTFYPIDRLVEDKPASHLVMVDEAATMASYLLWRLTQSYNRLVFSTTTEGYEGSGKGFLYRFEDQLKKLMPQYKRFSLTEPLRWSEHDVVDRFITAALFLNQPIEAEGDGDIVIKSLNRDKLLNDVHCLAQLFSLLRDAHYQTSPDDLAFMLDHPDVTLYVAMAGQEVCAALLTVQEGGFGLSDIDQIKSGRRLTGHLLPQQIANMGFEEALQEPFVRVVRIAVKHSYRRQGIASRLIHFCETKNAASYMGSSFSLDTGVMEFWHKLGFMPVRLGIHKDTSAGEYPCVVIKNKADDKLFQALREAFVGNLQVQLLALNNDLQASYVVSLFSGGHIKCSLRDKEQVLAYLKGHRSLEVVYSNLRSVFMHYLCNTSVEEKSDSALQLLVYRALMAKSWKDCSSKLDYSGRKSAESAIKDYLQKNVIDCLDV